MPKIKKYFFTNVMLCFIVFFSVCSFAAAYNHSVLPDEISESDVSGGTENPVTSGLNFSVSEPGRLIKVRLWVASGRSGLHTVAIWNADTGEKLAGPFNWQIAEGTTGWAYFTLDESIAIETGVSYGVTISDNVSTWMSAIHGYWENNSPASDVFVTYWRGFSGAADTLPTNWNGDGTYLVDVVFVTGEDDPGPATEPETNHNPDTGESEISGYVILLIIANVIFFALFRHKRMSVIR